MSRRAAAVLSGCALPGKVRVEIGLAGADGPPPQEAPVGFNTPSFDGAQTADGSIAGHCAQALYARHKSLSLDDAIQRHTGEVSEVERRVDELHPQEREALITFLKSL